MNCDKVLMSVSIALLRRPKHPLNLPKEFSVVSFWHLLIYNQNIVFRPPPGYSLIKYSRSGYAGSPSKNTGTG